MRQKYVIVRDGNKHQLVIMEYANTGKKLRNESSSIHKKAGYTFLCEETYESDLVRRSIPKGMNAMVTMLRTRNLYPIEPNATKIAESVMALYTSAEGGSVELFFDDVDTALN